jgi:hypothetical protein
MKTRISLLPMTFVLSLVISPALEALASTDQTTTERILRENKRFVDFINICATNFAETKKDDFRKAFEKHFNADIAYLQSDYKRAYRQVYASQGELEKLYHDIVKDSYLEDSKTILDKFAPGIIRSKNARARLYLTLGYRDRTVGYTYYTIAEASNPKFYSYKLYKYEDAIQMARRAKRFAFLALFESQGLDDKRKIYNQLCKSEKSANNLFFSRFVDLKEDDYIKEIDKEYDEKAEESKQSGEMKKPEEAKKGEEARKDEQAKKSTGQASADSVNEPVFEKKVERRVRFRSEAKAARFLINGEFDKAEDILRKYIDDFNFKLISASFEVLSATGTATAAAEKVDYNRFKVHLVDNYLRFDKKSLLDSIIDTIKVEDNIADKAKDKSKTEDKTAEAVQKETKTVVPEKKEEKAIKEEVKDTKDVKKELKGNNK